MLRAVSKLKDSVVSARTSNGPVCIGRIGDEKKEGQPVDSASAVSAAAVSAALMG